MAKNAMEEVATAEPEEIKKVRLEIAKFISRQIAEMDKKRVTNLEQMLNAIANMYTAIK